MQKVGARLLRHVVADAHADARELNRVLRGFVRHLWTSGAPYYCASETVNAVVSQASALTPVHTANHLALTLTLLPYPSPNLSLSLSVT